MRRLLVRVFFCSYVMLALTAFAVTLTVCIFIDTIAWRYSDHFFVFTVGSDRASSFSRQTRKIAHRTFSVYQSGPHLWAAHDWTSLSWRCGPGSLAATSSCQAYLSSCRNIFFATTTEIHWNFVSLRLHRLQKTMSCHWAGQLQRGRVRK